MMNYILPIMRLILLTLVLVALENSFAIGNRLYSFAPGDNDDEFYSSYQLSPILPSMTRGNDYQMNQRINYNNNNNNNRNNYHNNNNNNYFRSLTNTGASNLQALPSIISPSASIPFVVFGSGSNNGKKVNKKVSSNREKAVHSRPKAQETIDWSSEEMMQHPIDEEPRKVSITVFSQMLLHD